MILNAVNVPMLKITQHLDKVKNVVISPRGEYAASFGYSRYLVITKCGGEEVMKLDLRMSPSGINANHFCFSFCDKYVYIIQLGMAYRIEIKTGRKMLLDHITDCNAISVNELGNVVIGSDDYIAVVWDTPQKNGVGVSRIKHKHETIAVKITDSNEVIFGDRKGGVYQFDPLDDNMTPYKGW